MSAPIPGDPRALSVTPEKLQEQVEEVLGESFSSLEEEADILERAHNVLAQALQ
ncbi:Uncharacterised protein [Corynebacterium kutscheri]|uniref:Uncharacterized protein n=1 Tax=Corynebacterium kutscheri TaxID=35755 RepID=A0A0F6TDQ2_9CORY|nr:hypothetical protein [Corynebacterium kutscheri]AKE41149.1 hypothetical protein UL82_04850 [Corynebacterium kutscheri]VEH07058.1 Uncharacterised protein [Corynebacterium kutscheri]VEH09469.1 Uncharacterised protein [Corynebacterium kutscheri]VEH79554.1 Uncharacterised protein [Corynebacterium kutscheri]